MKSIGIRTNNTEIHYSVLKKSEDSIYSIEALSYLKIPVALTFPEQLNFIRKTFKDIIAEYCVNRAGIRVTEQTALNKSIERISFEAILQEVFASSSIEKYMTGQISNMSALLRIERNNFKKIISGELPHEIFNPEIRYSSNEKEAILAGLASLNL